MLQEGRYAEALAKLQSATKLLPKNAQAWNHLGLAFHHQRQLDLAARAYRQALVLDHKLAAPRYNLGCLYLEQTNLNAAIEELTAFTLANPASSEGWVRLGSAKLQTRRLDEAERCFATAIEQQVKQPEARNGLGLIALQRRRTVEAAHHFQNALKDDSQFRPALLNLAIVQQQAFSDRSRALDLYRQYLAVRPAGPTAEVAAVEATLRALQEHRAPMIVSQGIQNLGLQPAVKRAETPPPPERGTASSVNITTANVRVTARTSAPPSVAAAPVARTNRVSVNTHSAPSTSQIARANVESRPAVTTVRTAPPPVPPPTSAPPADLQVTSVTSDLVVVPPKDFSLSSASSAPLHPSPATTPDPGSHATRDEPEKKGLLTRINPFRSADRTRDRNGSEPPRRVILSSAPPPSAPARVEPKTFPRYHYLSPARLVAGNRREAEGHFRAGVAAHQVGRWKQALSEYQRAVELDPSYFEAHYNLGVAAQESRDYRRALSAYEQALALDSNAVDTRYNFALALKQASYPLDAAEELKRLVAQQPADARVHLLLGNLYAQTLDQPALAQPHYRKVLEIDPRHPEAQKIRNWLALNP